MEIEIFALCDAAADYQGRLSILGVFDSIYAVNVPVEHPQCAVALRLRVSRIEAGKHSLELHIVDNDGNLIIPPLKGEFQVAIPENVRQGVMNLVLNLFRVPFSRYGDYAVNLAIDSHELASLPFSVRQAQ